MIKAHPLPQRIQWHEGMLLTPQHFQHESARVDSLIAWQSLATNPYGWGVKHLEIDEPLLSSGLLRILKLEAIFPNGLVANYDVEQSHGLVLELDLAEWSIAMEQIDLSVYLVVGRTRSMNQPGQPTMFRGIETLPVEDEISQALAIDLPQMGVNLALSAAGSAPSAVYLNLRLMTLRKENAIVQRSLTLPPLLEMSADNPVRQRAQLLASQMRNKAVFIARQTTTPSSRLEDRLTMLEQNSKLASLISALPMLEALLRSPCVQPFPLYLALCAQLGSLSSLRAGAVPMIVPAYDHSDPFPAFNSVLNALTDLVDEVSQDWHTQTLVFKDRFFSIEIAQSWMAKRLVIGVRGRTDKEIDQWISNSCIGSESVWPSITAKRVLGAQRKRIEEAPELGLRANFGYKLYSLDTTQNFILPEESLLIGNSNESSQAQRPDEIVLFTKGLK
jgi:type VI secretion system protein ImpJ